MRDIRVYIAWCRVVRRLGAGGIAINALFIPSAWAGEHLTGPVPATVERVVDGDTLAVRAKIWLNQELRVMVRLSGIDTPERRGRCAEERALATAAQHFAEDFIANSAAPGEHALSDHLPQIWLSDISEGKYAGRVLARVANAAGEDLSNALLATGLARLYSGQERAGWCPRQQAQK